MKFFTGLTILIIVGFPLAFFNSTVFADDCMDEGCDGVWNYLNNNLVESDLPIFTYDDDDPWDMYWTFWVYHETDDEGCSQLHDSGDIIFFYKKSGESTYEEETMSFDSYELGKGDKYTVTLTEDFDVPANSDIERGEEYLFYYEHDNDEGCTYGTELDPHTITFPDHCMHSGTE